MSKGKYCPEIVETICNAIINLKGRVGSAKEAGINFDTFCTWMNEKPDFAEAVKKAEKQFEEKGKNVAIQSIFKHMDKSWQAAAWWLERKHKLEYSQKIDHSGEITTRLIRYPEKKAEGADV